jgi:hypothetical protein
VGEALNFADSLSWDKAANALVAIIGPTGQGDTIEDHVVLEFNGHANLPRTVECFCDQHQSPVGTPGKMILIKISGFAGLELTQVKTDGSAE